MKGQNGSDHPPPIDEMVRLVATLEATLGRVADGQRSLKAELKAFGGRVDALAGKIDTLSARVDELGGKVHRTNNLWQSVIDEVHLLRDAQSTLDRALDFFEAQQKARGQELERAHKALELAVDVVENRVRLLRDDVADRADTESEDR